MSRNNPGGQTLIQVKDGDWSELNRALRYVQESLRNIAPQGSALTSDLNFGGHKGINAADPSASSDLVTRSFADANYGAKAIRAQLVTLQQGTNPLVPLTNGSGTTIVGTHAQRITNYPASAQQIGAQFYETDRFVSYVVILSGGIQVWQYKAGTYNATVGTVPGDLGLNDFGFILWITVQGHLFKWVGNAWIFLDEEGGKIVSRISAPTSPGWQLCDGTTTDYLQISAGAIVATPFPTADENSGAAGVYHKSIAAYTGTINAAVAPALAGRTESVTATNISNNTGITVDAHTVVQDAADGTDHWDFDNEADASHNVNDPGHNHTQNAHDHGVGTLAVSAGGQPRNLGVLKYFRR